VKFADLTQRQLEQIKQTETSLNSEYQNESEELILLAYTKPDGTK